MHDPVQVPAEHPLPGSPDRRARLGRPARAAARGASGDPRSRARWCAGRRRGGGGARRAVRGDRRGAHRRARPACGSRAEGGPPGSSITGSRAAIDWTRWRSRRRVRRPRTRWQTARHGARRRSRDTGRPDGRTRGRWARDRACRRGGRVRRAAARSRAGRGGGAGWRADTIAWLGELLDRSRRCVRTAGRRPTPVVRPAAVGLQDDAAVPLPGGAQAQYTDGVLSIPEAARGLTVLVPPVT